MAKRKTLLTVASSQEPEAKIFRSFGEQYYNVDHLALEEDNYSLIYRAASAIFKLPQVIELRVLYKDKRVDSGYFDSLELLAKAASKYDREESVKGIYYTLNPLNPVYLERANNRMRESVSRSRGDLTTGDADILERRLILCDLDPVRPTGVSSTEQELNCAQRKADEIADFLKARGWEAPLIGMSGNGFHLLLATSLPNDAQSTVLVKDFLSLLSAKYSDHEVRVDTTVYNAGRITKAYGTLAKKGEPTESRPHRRAVLLGEAGGLVE